MSEMFQYSLFEVGNIVTGTTPTTNNPNYWNGDIPFFSPADFDGSVYCLNTERKITNKGLIFGRSIPEKSVMVTCIGSIGKIAININEGLTNQQINTLIPHPKFDYRYVYYLILNNIEKLINIAPQTTIPILNKTEFGRLSFSFHQYVEQQKIAAILQTIDQTIEKTEALIEKYQQIKAGLMHDLFTRGITADGKLRPPREQAPELYQETPIGWIPKDWGYGLLDDLTDRCSGHTPNKDHAEYWNGGIKWISLSDSRRLDNLYISNTDYEISKLGIQNSSAVMLPTGVVVMSRDAGIGKSAITTQPMAVSQHFMAWKCAKKMDHHFLYYWLQFKKRMFENIAMGSTIVTIGLPYFKRLKIATPTDLKEQIEIGKRLKKADVFIFSLKDDLEKLKKQKQGLMQDLLTGKVPVKVDNEAVHA